MISKADADTAWIGEQLKLHRLQQNDLATALGINASGVTRLLKGERRLRSEEIPLLHRFFAQFSQTGTTPPPRLIRALSLPEVDLGELARRTNLAVDRLLQIKYGQGAPASELERKRIGAAFGQDPDYLFDAEPLPAGHARQLKQGWKSEGFFPIAAPAAPRSAASGAKLPVYRALQSASFGAFEDRFLLAERREPVRALRDVDDGYGIFIEGDQLMPFACHADVIWVHPHRPIWPGSRAMARSSSGWIGLGILRSERNARWIDSGSTKLEIDPTVTLHAIVAIEAA